MDTSQKDPSEKLKLMIGSDKLIVGTNKTIKYLKLGKVKEIFIAKNAPEEIIEDIQYYAKLNNVPVYILKYDNEELGGLIRKPFKVAVISILKDG